MKRFAAVCTFAVLLFLPLLAMAATDHATIRFDNPVQVAGTKLQPGRYKVQWTGAGPAQVTFERNGRTVLTTPATVSQKPSPYDGGVETSQVNGSRVLDAIFWKQETIQFAKPATP